VFALAEDEAQGRYVAERICNKCGLSSENVSMTAPLNHGAAVITI
jgi:hypothetical protein